MTKKCASCDKIVIFWPILYVNKAHHSPLSLRSINQRIIARKTEWCNPFFAHQRVQLTMEWAHCKEETWSKNDRNVWIKQASNLFTLRCAWGGAPGKKPANGFWLPIPSASTAHTINCASWVRSDCQLASYPIHFFNRIQQCRNLSGASYTTKSSWKQPLKLNNYIVGSVGNRPVGQLRCISW